MAKQTKKLANKNKLRKIKLTTKWGGEKNNNNKTNTK